jgi:hypothetical protein
MQTDLDFHWIRFKIPLRPRLPDGILSDQKSQFEIWKKSVYFVAIWIILRPFGTGILWPFGTGILWPFGTGILCQFGNLVAICYIFPHFGILCQEKSGNHDPAPNFCDVTHQH